MTRLLRCPLLLILLVASCTHRVSTDPVYRYINVLDGTRLLLGEEFVRHDLAQHLDDTTHRLRPGVFAGGGTTDIVVQTDSDGILRSLTFTYDGSESLEFKVRDYTANLGPPAERRELPDGSRLYVWQDARTRFELHWSPGDEPRFWSRLIDRERS